MKYFIAFISPTVLFVVVKIYANIVNNAGHSFVSIIKTPLGPLSNPIWSGDIDAPVFYTLLVLSFVFAGLGIGFKKTRFFFLSGLIWTLGDFFGCTGWLSHIW